MGRISLLMVGLWCSKSGEDVQEGTMEDAWNTFTSLGLLVLHACGHQFWTAQRVKVSGRVPMRESNVNAVVNFAKRRIGRLDISTWKADKGPPRTMGSR